MSSPSQSPIQPSSQLPLLHSPPHATSPPPIHSGSSDSNSFEERWQQSCLNLERLVQPEGHPSDYHTATTPSPLPVPPRRRMPPPTIAPATTAEHFANPLSAETILHLLNSHGEGVTLEQYRDMAQHLARTVIQTTTKAVGQHNTHQAALQELASRPTPNPVTAPSNANGPPDDGLPPYPAAETRARTCHAIQGFSPNNGRYPNFYIPSPMPTVRNPPSLILTPFIRVLPNDPLRVEGTIEGTFIYTHEVRSMPYGEDADQQQPNPAWLLNLLHPDSGWSDLLVDEARHIGDAGLRADLLQHRHLMEELTNIRSKLNLLAITEDSILAQRGQVHLWLERAQAGTRLAQLAYVADYDWHTERQQSHQIARRGGRGCSQPSS